MKKNILSCFVFVLFLQANVEANVKLPAIISDNMVLQADARDPIWGWADPNEKVTVSIAGQKKQTQADTAGKWSVKLDPIRESSSVPEMTVAGKNQITVHNILVGQVWLGSGQSNIHLMVRQVNNAKSEIENAKYPNIRLFNVSQTPQDTPAEDCAGKWVECSPETIPDFSAVLYFFGRDLHKDLKQPVGLIRSSWGGTPIEAWTSNDSLGSGPAAEPIYAFWKQAAKDNAAEEYKGGIEQWKKDAKAARAAGKRPPKKPLEPQLKPSVLYNGMIAPLIPYEIKGVVWYQGEANSKRAYQYRTLLPLLIKDWRAHWSEGDFSFYFVQLPNFNNNLPFWPELRQAQFETLKSVPNTGMAVTIDIGDPNNLHPKNKQDVGKRLELIALAKDYGRKIEYLGPIYKNAKTVKNEIVISFEHVGEGLIVKGSGELKGFEIAGPDRKFVPAKAHIQKPEKSSADWAVAVSSPDVNDPVAVRYGWQNDPEGINLYNSADLPASPFKTDNWPWETQKFTAPM